MGTPPHSRGTSRRYRCTASTGSRSGAGGPLRPGRQSRTRHRGCCPCTATRGSPRPCSTAATPRTRVLGEGRPPAGAGRRSSRRRPTGTDGWTRGQSRSRVRIQAAGGLNPPPGRGDPPHRLGQQSGVGRVLHVRRHHRGVRAHPRRAQQLAWAAAPRCARPPPPARSGWSALPRCSTGHSTMITEGA